MSVTNRIFATRKWWNNVSSAHTAKLSNSYLRREKRTVMVNAYVLGFFFIYIFIIHVFYKDKIVKWQEGYFNYKLFILLLFFRVVLNLFLNP